MIDRHITHPWAPEVVKAVARFKQGHLVEHPPFFYAACGQHGVWKFTKGNGDPTLSSELLEIDPVDCPPYGLITTQTCDLNEQSPKPKQPWFAVAPVYRVAELPDQSLRGPIRKDMVGHLVLLHPPRMPDDEWVADVRIEMPVEKSWLVGRTPIEAFPNEAGYLSLARRLARRRERPALDNSLSNQVVRTLRKGFEDLRKTEFDHLLDAVREIRVSVTNGTRLDAGAAQLIVIPHQDPPPSGLREWFDEWWDGASRECAQVGLSLLTNRYIDLDTLTAAEYAASIPIDFDYLSPDE